LNNSASPPQEHNILPKDVELSISTQLDLPKLPAIDVERQRPSTRDTVIEFYATEPRSLPEPDVSSITTGLSRHKRQPIARKWSIARKRFTAAVACITTFAIGLQIGMYSGMVPQIQYQLADLSHHVIQGNVYLYIGMAMTTFVFWSLPLCHGRKPYLLVSLSLVLPLQFPQALMIMEFRSPTDASFRSVLLTCRFLTGLLLGFANINHFPILLDLFGASLQSEFPHQELVVPSDTRRDGGGIGLWLGFWTWCWIGSLAIGFTCGAGIIYALNPKWGFYMVMVVLAVVLLLNILAPETRRSASRRS
jgi:hypothetical protein